MKGEIIKMEIFKAIIYNDNNIELNNSEELDKLYYVINNDENFILQWIEESV